MKKRSQAIACFCSLHLNLKAMRYTTLLFALAFMGMGLLTGCKDAMQPDSTQPDGGKTIQKQVTFDLEQHMTGDFVPSDPVLRAQMERLGKTSETLDPYYAEQQVAVSLYEDGGFLMDMRTLWNENTTLPRDVPDVPNVGLTRITPTETLVYDENGNVIERLETQTALLDNDNGGAGELAKTGKPTVPFAAPTVGQIPASAAKGQEGNLTTYTYKEKDPETGEMVGMKSYVDPVRQEIVRETAEIPGKVATDISYTYQVVGGDKMIASQKSVTRTIQKEGESVITNEMRFKNVKVKN